MNKEHENFRMSLGASGVLCNAGVITTRGWRLTVCSSEFSNSYSLCGSVRIRNWPCMDEKELFQAPWEGRQRIHVYMAIFLVSKENMFTQNKHTTDLPCHKKDTVFERFDHAGCMETEHRAGIA